MNVGASLLLANYSSLWLLRLALNSCCFLRCSIQCSSLFLNVLTCVSSTRIICFSNHYSRLGETSECEINKTRAKKLCHEKKSLWTSSDEDNLLTLNFPKTLDFMLVNSRNKFVKDIFRICKAFSCPLISIQSKKLDLHISAKENASGISSCLCLCVY